MKAVDVVRLGLLKFPSAGRSFPGRPGRTSKPYVVDTRGAGTSPELRGGIVNALLEEAPRLPDFDVFAGIAKSGTVWAAWSAWKADAPFANVLLDGPRVSGLQREVEGDVQGLRVLLVDNWVRSGDSITRAENVVMKAGGVVVAALSVVRSGDVKLTVPLRSAWTIAELLDAALREGLWRPKAEPTLTKDTVNPQPTGAVK